MAPEPSLFVAFSPAWCESCLNAVEVLQCISCKYSVASEVKGRETRDAKQAD